GADMHGVLAWSWRGGSHQAGEERGLPVVEGSLRDDGNHDIVVEINRVAAWRRRITAVPPDDLPRPWTEDFFALDRRESRFDPPVAPPRGCHHTLRIGAPKNIEPGFV